jgi:hypothetical protein
VSSEPFDAIHADPWARELIDLASLNANASGAVEEAIEKLRRDAAGGGRALRSSSLVILGPPGAGKTHLFARLRRRVGPRATFVHIRPLVHAELTVRFVLGEVVRQLAYLTPQGLPQANALVGSLLGALTGVGSGYPSAALTLFTKLGEAEREARLDAEVERVLSMWPEVDETYLQRLLRVPFASGPMGRALLAWLSGRDCDASQLERIGAAVSLSEERALPALQTLTLVAAVGAPLVIMFDQLENLMDGDGAGPRLRAYAHLASECVDVLRGAVIVHLALDSEWERGIEPSFNASQRSRIVMRRELLSLPRAAEREELLRLLSARVPEPHEAFPWPLGDERLERLRTQPGITPRLLLVAFRRALAGEPDEDAPEASNSQATAPPADDGVATAPPSVPDLSSEWQAQLDAARLAVQAAGEAREALDAARLADGVLASGAFIPGLRVRAHAKPPTFLALEREGKTELVAFVQESSPKSVGSTLTKLAALTAPVVALRERAREFPPTWHETLKKQRALLDSGRARWLDLDPEDGARLLALAALLQAARSGDVTDARGAMVSERHVAEWVGSTLDVPSWPISAGLRAPEPVEATPPAPTPPEPSQRLAPAALPTPGPRSDANAARNLPAPSATLAVLRRLRVASLDRLLREVARVQPECTRATLLAELAAAGERVTWFGRSIVCLRLEP